MAAMQSFALIPEFSFLEKVEAAGPFHAEQCFQCRKCTNGCPASFAMDLYPDQVIRLTLLGQKEEVLRCRTIWVCASCETCTTRCPNGIRIAEMMDHLKELAVAEGVGIAEPNIFALHQSFLENVLKKGRVFEGTLILRYLLRSGQWREKVKQGTWRDEVRLAWRLFQMKRLSFFPRSIRGKEELLSKLRPSKKTGA
jgi:heterodisulfide reductase subunit C2